MGIAHGAQTHTPQLSLTQSSPLWNSTIIHNVIESDHHAEAHLKDVEEYSLAEWLPEIRVCRKPWDNYLPQGPSRNESVNPKPHGHIL